MLFTIASALMISENMQAQIYRTIATYTDDTVSYIQIYEYNSVDVQPHFPGGETEMIKFINRERRYPVSAYEKGVQGRVMCGFVVNEDGSISNINVMKSVEESLDNEAVRIISQMPPWLAGVYGNRAVPVFCVISIPFRR